MRKLKSVLVDGDSYAVKTLESLCINSPVVELTRSFSNPKEFLDKAPFLDFDLCILDTCMKEMEGLLLAQMLNGKPFIFVTADEGKLRDALSLSPVDIVMKPIFADRLDKAFHKAHKLLVDRKQYAMFNVAESSRKVKICMPDVLLVTADDVDARHKKVILKDHARYTIMDCAMSDLLKLSSNLVQVNKKQLVSLDAVHEVQHDTISLKGMPENETLEITLGRAFKEGFRKKIFYR